MEIIKFVIFGLATWRMASLLVSEKGPFGLFARIREWVGIEEMRVNNSPEIYKAVPDTFFGQLLDCVWCCSIWVGIGWTVFYWLTPVVAVWLGLPLALSAVAIWFESWMRR